VNVKSKKQQFKEEMTSMKSALSQEKEAVENLERSKKQLQDEIQSITQETSKYQKETEQLKNRILELLKQNKSEGLISKLEKFQAKLEAYQLHKAKLDELDKSLMDDLNDLRHFMERPPEKEKKNLKAKSVEKVEPGLGLVLTKLANEQKKHVTVQETTDDLKKACTSLATLLK
jgi:hypothetical protein